MLHTPNDIRGDTQVVLVQRNGKWAYLSLRRLVVAAPRQLIHEARWQRRRAHHHLRSSMLTGASGAARTTPARTRGLSPPRGTQYRHEVAVETR
jgi:hypothetical protein